ncbi:uncharacterized protein LOC120103897 [Phoenix dactylifera]|uniref:Uncharacterized protein LOC120103897 n=2 Tax=Phoenix dactylifera TaxID=42345 RepID=A0A8B9A339_PHODC|nr:uncharacterized protein LOC120103897 [Phoenix dactylifera]
MSLLVAIKHEENEASAKKSKIGAKTPPFLGGHRNPNERHTCLPSRLRYPAFLPPSYSPAEHRTPMAGLSFYLDGVPLDSPLLSPCNGLSLSPAFADPETELRRHFDQISATLAVDSSPESPGFESLRSDLVERWVQRFLGGGGEGSPCDRRFSLCPGLRRRIEALIRELVSERMDRLKEAGTLGSSPGSPGSKKRKRDFENMLMLVRTCAANPFCGMTGGGGGGGGGGEWLQKVLIARRTMYLSSAGFANVEDFPSYPESSEQARKRRKAAVIQPQRRSPRIAQKLKVNARHLVALKKRIGVGASFQADVLEWTGLPSVKDFSEDNEDLDDSRWLGTRVWPLESDDRRTSEVTIGKGRPDSCACASPGSIACIRSHVSSARLQLQSDLGQAFFSWEFDGMGEDVSKLWTHGEQMSIDPLERLNPESYCMTFWKLAEKCFTSKSRQDLVRYYFNVFIPRRMSYQSSLPSAEVNSEEDDDDGNNNDANKNADDNDDKKGKALQASPSRSSRRSKNSKKKR